MYLLNRLTLATAALLSTPLQTLATPFNPNITTLSSRAHDWHECWKIKISGRQLPDHPEDIPPGISHESRETLQCNPSPRPEHEDVHCGNVLHVIKDFCGTQTTNPSTYINGYKYYKHEDYITGTGNTLHLKYMLKDHIDDFVLNIAPAERCQNSDGGVWERQVPTVWDRCTAAFWGGWTECNNQGRGGSITVGCQNFTLAVVE